MEIVIDEEFRRELLDKITMREFKERTGVHSSDVVYCVNKQGLRRRNPTIEADHVQLIYSLGWSTQRWLTGQTEDEPSREVDGILVTCDALYEGSPWELKATFQSSSRAISDNMFWLRQIMAQCHVMSCTEARLSRLEIMGNWKSIFGSKEEKALNLPENQRPTLSAYKLTFTKAELERNWKWMLERKRLFEKVLETGKLYPPRMALPDGQEFECQYCSYKGKECVGV